MASVADENASVKVETRVSFQLGLNAADFPAATDPSKPAHMSAKLTICSTLKPALVLEFFSAQRYDAVITNGEGVAVYHWSNGRVFPQIASLVPVDGEMDWVIDIPLADDHGVALPPGPYVIRAYLMTFTGFPGVQDHAAFAGVYSGSLYFRVGS
jgi:Intracellular proteinase inhibitor